MISSQQNISVFIKIINQQFIIRPFDIHQQMKGSALDMSKYTSIRMKLAQEDSSGSDAQDDQIPLIASQLLPNYYKYRRYLVQFLKENHVNLKNYPHVYLPDSHIQERIKKCAEERIYFQKKGNKKDHKIGRTLVTEKLIQKNRKKLKQQRQLLKKYQAKQIDAILEQNNEYGKSVKLVPYQEPSFDQKHFRRRSSTEQMFLGRKNNQLSESKSKMDSKASNSSNIGQSKIIQNGKTSQVIQKIKNKNIKITDDEQQYEYEYESDEEGQNELKNNKENQNNKQRRPSKTHKDHKKQVDFKKTESKIPQKKLPKREIISNYPQIPKLKMRKKVETPSQRSDESENDQSGIESSQQQFFISNNKIHANLVSIDHEDTHSEYKLKPLVRQNTPNFDTFSQKVKPNNFYEQQKQKLKNQMQQAQKIHNQISVVIGETEEQDNGKLGTSRNNNNNILSNLSSKAYSNNTSEKISDFIYSFKYILEEICELNSYSQCYKYLLKNKQYEIITCLYEQKIGTGPVYSKPLMKKVKQLIKKEQPISIDFIIGKIFGSQLYISFQDFSQVFTSNISESQYSIISVKATQIHAHNVPELLSRLFSIWLQIKYFEQKLRKLYSTNSTQSDQICEKMTAIPNRNTFDFQKIEKFLYSTSHNRANLLKVKLCFNKYFKVKKFNEFISILQKKI